MTLKLNELSKLQEAAKGEALGELVRKAKGKPNGQLKQVDAKIRSFEIRYEMSSADMREQLGNGALRDTAEIAKWLILVTARDRARQ